MDTSGGVRLTLEKELAVMPCQVGCSEEASASVVTTVTPLGHWASTSRKTDRSTTTHLLINESSISTSGADPRVDR